ncbi:MAG TPA: ABC transporter permease [Ktedonobacterales bacterium]|nr:ABC transporter permease [Ktedonobacterales bacterium]
MRHLIRRLTIYLLAVWAAVTLNFFLPRLVPGDPASALFFRLSQHGSVSPNLLNALKIEFGVDTKDPLWVQYFQYLNNLLHGNLGVSTTFFPNTVADVINQNIRWTLTLLTVSVLISFALGTLIGIFMAWRRGSAFDTTLSSLMTFFYSLLYPWLAFVALYFFAFVLGWFPVLGGGYDASQYTPGWDPGFILDAAYHAILPAFTIVLSTIAGWMLTMRNTMITTLSEDYVMMAKAKGLTSRRVMFAYAARNAILPSVTSFALALGGVIGGQLFVEAIFSYPGIGFSLFQGIQNDDFALTQGILLLVILTTVVMNLIADLLYTVLDPRVRQERSA